MIWLYIIPTLEANIAYHSTFQKSHLKRKDHLPTSEPHLFQSASCKLQGEGITSTFQEIPFLPNPITTTLPLLGPQCSVIYHYGPPEGW